MTIIGTKWMYRNKLDENGIVSQNKARLVAQGYNQQEGINYDETYALVARLESIGILLAYACALDFKLFQMDVKSAFINSFINEEVYVAQPSGFIDFEKPNHVYKLKKALYGLKQALKAWFLPEIYSMAGEDEFHDGNPPPPVIPTQQAPHTLSTIKLPILKKSVSTKDANQKFLRSLPASWSQVDEFDLEEMDLKWKVAMISMRLKKFYKNTGRKLQFDAKEPVGFDKTKVECFNCHNTRHFARECISKGNQESRRRDARNTGYKAKDNRRRHGKQEEPKALQVSSNTEMSAKDKSGLGYGDQIHEGVLSYENDSCESVLTESSDVENVAVPLVHLEWRSTSIEHSFNTQTPTQVPTVMQT
ncbi:copia protein [Tanacetum coccineum]